MGKKSRSATVYDDIAAWTSGVERFKERTRAMGAQAAPMCNRIRLDGLSSLRCYALLLEFIAPQPNGILTFFIREGTKPAENLVWWDFVFATPKHLVTVHSGADGLAADVYEAPAGFDIERFLARNCERHRARVDARIATFERHEVYANQYYAYRHAAEWLKGELLALDATEPTLTGGIYSEDVAARRELARLRGFGPTAMKHHVLAKNLVMNSAFACEALVTTLFRLGALPHLVRQREVLRPLLRGANFMQKLEVFHAYTILFEHSLDVKARAVQRVRALMEKRNKYVHAEQSEHTRLEDVFFDGDFPLYGGGPRGQLVDFLRRTWLVPTKEEALDAFDCAEAFRTFLFDAMRAERRQEMQFCLDQPQIGYNTQTGRNSVVFPVTPVQTFFVGGRPGEQDDSSVLVLEGNEVEAVQIRPHPEEPEAPTSPRAVPKTSDQAADGAGTAVAATE